MLKQWRTAEAARALLGYEQRLVWGEYKKIVLATLGAWIAYFLIVNMFVRSLNKILIPVLGLPLGFYLAIQGAVVVFAVALYVLSRGARGTSET